VKAVVQRVTSTSVSVDGHIVGSITRGLLVFVGVERDDAASDVQYIAGKIRDLRVFPDPSEPSRDFDQSVGDIGGAILVVSQFTLAADCRKGRRPSFDAAAPPDIARPIYEQVIGELRSYRSRSRNRRIPGEDAGLTPQRRTRHVAPRQPSRVLS